MRTATTRVVPAMFLLFSCAPMIPKPTDLSCQAEEKESVEENRDLCVVPACDEFDPDQHGEPLGVFSGGCKMDDGKCDPVSYGSHKGGNTRHNQCADERPFQNQFVPPNVAKSADSVVSGTCFDGSDVTMENGMRKIRVWEVKTARYGFSRKSNKPVCTFFRKKILLNVIASIAKEMPIAKACNHEYHLLLADRELFHAWVKLTGKDPFAVNLYSTNLPNIPGTSGVVTRDALFNEAKIDPKLTMDIVKLLPDLKVDFSDHCDKL